jgi:hypothetical protein
MAVAMIIVAVLAVVGVTYYLDEDTYVPPTTTTSPVQNVSPVQNNPDCIPNAPAWIKVLSPNGGEAFTSGQQVTVTWSKCNTATNSSMMLLLKSTQGSLKGADMGTYPNTGSATVTIPSVSLASAPLSSGNYYKIRAMSYGVGFANDPIDESDNVFTINNQVPPNVSTTIISQYIGGTEWPPAITTTTTAYACQNGVVPNTEGNEVYFQRTINGKVYCIHSIEAHSMGGLTGRDYMYTRANGSGTKIATFELRWHYCDVNFLTSAQYNQCQNDQVSVFGNLDAIVDSLM